MTQEKWSCKEAKHWRQHKQGGQKGLKRLKQDKLCHSEKTKWLPEKKQGKMTVQTERYSKHNDQACLKKEKLTISYQCAQVRLWNDLRSKYKFQISKLCVKSNFQNSSKGFKCSFIRIQIGFQALILVLQAWILTFDFVKHEQCQPVITWTAVIRPLVEQQLKSKVKIHPFIWPQYKIRTKS